MINRYKNDSKKYYRKWLVLPLFLLTALYATAQSNPQATKSSLSEAAVIVAVIAIAVLALVIFILANSVVAARAVYEERLKQEASNAAGSAVKTVALLVTTLLAATPTTFAQAVTEKTAAASDGTIGGLPAITFYVIMSVIVLEFVVILVLVNILKYFTGIKTKPFFNTEKLLAPPSNSGLTAWWNKINKSVAIEREKDIDLSHDYDGIRELDNAVPPWWSWTFIASILFGVVYMWRFHVSETAPLQLEELRIAMRKADVEQQAYLKMAANKVDENTVKLMDASGIAAGKSLFAANCVACHGANGEGNAVGPNLTDEYWLHKGSISDVFKTIKYGVVEKGMKSWKDDFTPTQIAQLSSFVKSLKGTKPVNARAPQGDLYNEQATAPAGDSASRTIPVADTVNTTATPAAVTSKTE